MWSFADQWDKSRRGWSHFPIIHPKGRDLLFLWLPTKMFYWVTSDQQQRRQSEEARADGRARPLWSSLPVLLERSCFQWHFLHLLSELQLHEDPAAARAALLELQHKREPLKYLTEATEIGVFAIKSLFPPSLMWGGMEIHQTARYKRVHLKVHRKPSLPGTFQGWLCFGLTLSIYQGLVRTETEASSGAGSWRSCPTGVRTIQEEGGMISLEPQTQHLPALWTRGWKYSTLKERHLQGWVEGDWDIGWS